LLNKNSVSLGSAFIPIRSEKKAQKILDQLRIIENAISEGISPLKSLSISEIQPLSSSLHTILSNISSTIKDNIQEGDFSVASNGINQLKQMQGFITPLVKFLSQYSELYQKMGEDFQVIKENTENLIKSLDDIEKQLSS